MALWIDRAASWRPDRVAVQAPERSLTYAELVGRARALCRRLWRCGVRGGDRVAVELPPGAEFVVALHACMLAGAAIVPIDLRLSERERTLRRAGAVVSIAGGEAFGDAADEHSLEAADGLHGAADDGGAPGGNASADDSVLAVMHTSGTSAEPKAVELTRANFLHSALASAAMLGLDAEERWLCPMPLTHVGGLSIPIRSAIYATTVVLHGRFELDAVLEELMDPGRRITLVSLVPTMLARLLDAGLKRPPTLRWALLGGGPIAPALLARAAAAGVPVAPTYGMTEACSQIATFGHPLAGVELGLRGPQNEIVVRGPIVSPGALSDDGWLHTGDVGAFDEHGALAVVGRISETIVTGGENVAPAEVEAVLLEHPAIADAAVYGAPDPQWGERVMAKVVVRNGSAPPSPQALRDFCVARLARFKVPKEITFVAELPRTPSGKLLRRALRATDDPAAGTEAVTPADRGRRGRDAR
jgi:O-succinylbenzoic acid--CoA ligase